MNKLIRILALPALLSTGVALLPGCGGGNSGISTTTPARFAGTAISDQNGILSGTLVQPGVGSFPLTGTIGNNGALLASATVGTSQVATLRGTVANKSGGYIISGTFTTNFGTTTVVSGTVTGTRTSTSTVSSTPVPTGTPNPTPVA